MDGNVPCSIISLFLPNKNIIYYFGSLLVNLGSFHLTSTTCGTGSDQTWPHFILVPATSRGMFKGDVLLIPGAAGRAVLCLIWMRGTLLL